MSGRSIFISLSAVLLIGIVISFTLGPNAQTGEEAAQLMAVLFSKSKSLTDAPIPSETSHGQKRKLSGADLEQLHRIFSQYEFSGSSPEAGGSGMHLDRVAELTVTYPGGRISFPIYRFGDSCIYRLEIYAAGLNSIMFIKDSSAQFEEFLNRQ
jgi:hypothetical protein